MTEPAVASIIELMFEASRTLFSGEHETTRFALGDRLVELNSTFHQNVSGIDLHGAFRPIDGSQPADFRLTVIDDETTGTRPALNWPTSWFEPFGIVRADLSGPIRFAVDIHSRSLSAYDPTTREAVVWFHDLCRIPYWFAATPFRLQMSWFADFFNGEMIHAAGIEVNGSTALLVGAGGAGKSTLTLAAMHEGARIFGDDFLLLTERYAHPVYKRTKFHDTTLELFNSSDDSVGKVMNAGIAGEKRIMDTNETFLSSNGAAIAAVFVPRIGEQARVRSISEAQAVRSALGPTMLGLLGGSRGTLSRIVDLVRAVPAFEIEVGPDMTANARAVFTTVEKLCPAPSQHHLSIRI